MCHEGTGRGISPSAMPLAALDADTSSPQGFAGTTQLSSGRVLGLVVGPLMKKDDEKSARTNYGRNLRTSQNTPVPTVSQASVLSASASEMRLTRASAFLRSPSAMLCTEPSPRLRRTFQLYPVGLSTKSPSGGLAVRVCRRNIAL